MADKNLIESEDIRLTLTGVRLAFTDAIFEAKPYKGGKPKFSCKFLIPKDSENANLVKQAMLDAAVKKYKETAQKDLLTLKAENRLCLTDGDLKDYDGYAGNYVLSASNKTRPKLKYANATDIIKDDGTLYSGCYVIAYVGLWAQMNEWGKRINCNLRGIQFYTPGEAFTGGGVADDDEFQPVPGAAATGEKLSANNASFM